MTIFLTIEYGRKKGKYMNQKEKETGFPSPAQGYEAKTFDFNRILLKNPPATFIMEAAASGMEWRGIFPGSLLVVDRSIKPQSGAVVVAAYDGDFLCREMGMKNNRITFTDGKNAITPGEGEAVIFGTVRAVVTLL
jgi:DNA polymerase V